MIRFTLFLSAAVTAVLATTAPATASENYATKYKGYRLAFNDEFDKGERPDENVWRFETGYCRNHEDQYYHRDNASLKDGLLVIEARKEEKEGMHYTSASMITRDDKGLNWQYGIYEVRAKLPCFTGCWPAIWTTGSHEWGWPHHGEIDIMEYYPSDGEEALHANVAWGGRHGAAWNSKVHKLSNYADVDTWRNQFHTWTMIYTEKSIRLYCDNDLLNEIDLDTTVNAPGRHGQEGANPFRMADNRQHVWLNLALGGDNGGSLEETPFPCHYYVDYVRVYVPENDSTAAPDNVIVDAPALANLPD